MKPVSLTIALAAAILAGCNAVKPGSTLTWGKDSGPAKKATDDDNDLKWNFGLQKKKELDEPVKMFVTWTDSVYTQVGAPATRGFAARIYFYNKNYQPIEVDGSLVVYGFDDTKHDGAKRSADKKFVFEAEHLASRFSVTQIGPSYSIWVPWDAVGGQQKSISLLPVFRAQKGQIVRGEQVVNILRGKQSIAAESDRAVPGDSTDRQSVKQVAFNAPIDAQQRYQDNASPTTVISNSTGMKTTTIPVPRSTLRHLQAPLAPVNNSARGLQLPPPTTRAAPQPSSGESSHYIFDNHRSPIRPRVARRYTTAENGEPGTPARFTPAAVIPPNPPATQPLARSALQTPQAPAARHAQPGHARAQWQQYRARPPLVQPTTTQ